MLVSKLLKGIAKEEQNIGPGMKR